MAGPGTLFDGLATGYDRGMAPLERLGLASLRKRLLAGVAGRTLEIGIGTGANLSLYPHDGCVTGLDESAEMVTAAAARAQAAGRCMSLSRASIERLPFPDATFDTVVGSLVLCSVVDVDAALDEIRRVVRPAGGQLLLLEHTRPDSPFLGRLADAVNVPWLAVQGRCHVNRRTDQMVAWAGFAVERIERHLGGLVRLIIAHAP